MKRLVWIYIFFLVSITCYAQSSDSVRAVRVLARAQKERILLRWGVTDPISWQYANKYGYTVERYTILRDGKLLKNPERKVLTPIPLKPAPQAAWEKVIDRNDYAAIAAQSIFGSSFEVNPVKNKGKHLSIVELINQATEVEQRFSFALFAADHSYEAAILSGLALTDSAVRKNEKYFYKIFALVPSNIARIDTGAFYIGLSDHADLPKPEDLTAEFRDRQVKLRWPVKFLRSIYVSYTIERSEDKGKSYRKVNDKPFINTNSSREEDDHFIKLDSIDNNKEYYYRIRGTTPFGEVGPPSEPVKGMGIDPLSCSVAINNNRVDDKNKSIFFSWVTECTGAGIVQGYEVQRSPSESGDYKTIHDKTLSADINQYMDKVPMSTNYYRVVVKGNNGQQRVSFPVLIQLADSIPPAAPQSIKILIDTAGIVQLSWQPNTERDLLGYRVFRSNFANDEYSQITVSPIRASAFRDTINLKTLTRKIYYKVTAIDTRFNMSEYSVPVDIVKPDILPPVPPVFKEVKALKDGALLVWIPSSSEDVRQTVLYKKHHYSNDWVELIRLPKDSVRYKDKIQDARNEYQYQLIAVDEAGNKSIASKPVRGKRLDDGVRPALKDLNAEVNRTTKQISLRWSYQQERVSKYIIYRAQNAEPLMLYKSVPAGSYGMIDTNLTMATMYRYRVKVIFSDGGESPFSEEVKVDY